MRTTVDLPDELYRAVRVKAARDGRTVRSLLEEALRHMLDEADDDRPTYRVRPLIGGDSPRGVPLDDNAALRDLMDTASAER